MAHPIDLYYWPTPNGWKITIFLEETGLPYNLIPVDITSGDQYESEFLKISPNNKMPAIVDHDGPDGQPISVFESGAILRYLADKIGRFGGEDLRGRVEVDEWLAWQIAGQGPMTGQYGHFTSYAPEKIDYAIDRYTREVQRLLGVLDKRLAGRAFIAGDDYTIADMAAYPWINPYTKAPLDLEPYPELRRWHASIAARPATGRAYALTKQVNPDAGKPLSEEERKQLFGR